MKAKQKTVPVDHLVVIMPAPPPDSPPLGVGDRCTYNSGSPPLLVVDCDERNVTLAWEFEAEVSEHVIARACVRRSP